MKRLHIFLIILIMTIGVLVSLAAVAWYLAITDPSYYGSSWMAQMWGGTGGMMGSGGSGASSYLWAVPVLLVAASAVAVIGIIFYLAFPELKYIKGKCDTTKTESTLTNSTENVETMPADLPVVTNNCKVLLKTMTTEEKKVLNVLISHQGKYLQKYVGKEAGLSRLKTHRVVARFTQRGIVTVKELGNTNEILLSDWVKSSTAPKANAI